jgi:hypothetical protein
MRLCASVIAIAVLSPLSAFAQEPPPGAPPAAPPGAPPAAEAAPPPAAAPAPAAAAAAPAAPAAPAKTWKDLVTFDGLVDAYYLYNFSGTGTNSSLVPPNGRAFDTNSNTFTLNYARLGIGMTADNVGLRIDAGYGAMGNIINSSGIGFNPMTNGTSGLAFFVEQAYAEVIPVPGLTLDLGKFDTTAGAEVIQANKNWLYSRSFLFNAIPLVHTGFRAGYKINDMVSVQGSVVNGWNGQGFEVDGNSAKTFGVNASLTFPMGLSIIPTIYVGKENTNPMAPAGVAPSTRFLGDLVASYTMGNLGLNLNFDYIKDESWFLDPLLGVALMGHYTVSDHLNVTGRFEYVQNTAASGATANKLEEVTVGIAAPVAGHFEVRPEIRADFSSPHVFVESFDPMTATKGTQVTGLLAFLGYF